MPRIYVAEVKTYASIEALQGGRGVNAADIKLQAQAVEKIDFASMRPRRKCLGYDGRHSIARGHSPGFNEAEA